MKLDTSVYFIMFALKHFVPVQTDGDNPARLHRFTSSFFQNLPLERWKCIHCYSRRLDGLSHVENVAQSTLDALIIC